MGSINQIDVYKIKTKNEMYLSIKMTSGQQEPRSLTNRMSAVIFHAVDFDQLEVGCIHNMVLPNSCSGRTPLMSPHSYMITFKLLKETLPAFHHCVAINTQTVAAWS
ncbi:hypothetical protein EGR_03573 [Echinococcus granulosus]|uniref:Uncharacterized protein n=1 Tax=Echinococcus granulosus TaxID=6210 RepID=W6V5F6_ECHGR|nr:hypothetical protein EGR_03573 [Echinococcus granulosus]EUB61509.1 hypothetical protein EGR_03573 [Echinococcus granulosus]